MNPLFLENLLRNYLLEDAHYRDLTTDSIASGKTCDAYILAKKEGILAGGIFLKPLLELLDKNTEIELLKDEGKKIKEGDVVAHIRGKDKTILYGERTALNIIQRCSGIATKTYRLSSIIKKYKAQLTDTRKTTPGFRLFEKYAVRVGGGTNHRMGLFDCVLIKDNHIKIAGSIKEAVKRVKENIPFTTKIEVEVENLEMLKEALSLKVDIIMLDNMNIEEMKKAVKIANGKATLEASGNIDERNIEQVAKTGVDYISCGAIVHHAVWLDMSMEIK
ncbi:MAG: carboxylating nicotinate-nucleotide diphosphorylase [Deltaproteobacteria bacterium]|nr:carboxylating nicotinate-nucleotide diphosphorylase [Deltaproteobacteria bacterium]